MGKKNLVNKQRIGKQDPYCTVAYGSDKKQTKPIKKGGQTPVWDEELRFELWETQQDELPSEITHTGGIRPIKDAPKLAKSAVKTKKELKVAVYADDPKVPEIVGENTVDISEIHKTGEWDGWVHLLNKGRYQGEVKLELTFYSAAPEPPKRRPLSTNYSGPGTFEPSTASAAASPPSSLGRHSRPSSSKPDPYSIPAHLRPGSATGSIGTTPPSTVNSRLSIDGSIRTHNSRLSVDGIASGLRASTSFGNLATAARTPSPQPGVDPARQRRSSFTPATASRNGWAESQPDPNLNLPPLVQPRRSHSTHLGLDTNAAPVPSPGLSAMSRSPSTASTHKPLPIPTAPFQQPGASQYQEPAYLPDPRPHLPHSTSSFNMAGMAQHLPQSVSTQTLSAAYPIQTQPPLTSSYSSYDVHGQHAAPQDGPFYQNYGDPASQPQTLPTPAHPVSAVQQQHYASGYPTSSPSPLHQFQDHAPDHGSYYTQSTSPVHQRPLPQNPPYPSSSPLQQPQPSNSYEGQQPPRPPPRSQSTSFGPGYPNTYPNQASQAPYPVQPPPTQYHQPGQQPVESYPPQATPNEHPFPSRSQSQIFHQQQQPLSDQPLPGPPNHLSQHGQSSLQQMGYQHAPDYPSHGQGQEQGYGQPYGQGQEQGYGQPYQPPESLPQPPNQYQQPGSAYQPHQVPTQQYMTSPPPLHHPPAQPAYQAVHFAPTYAGSIPPAVPPRPGTTIAYQEHSFAQPQPPPRHAPLPTPPPGSRPLPPVQQQSAPPGWSQQQFQDYLRSQAQPM